MLVTAQNGKTYLLSGLSWSCHLSWPSTVTLSYQMTFEPGQEACIPVVSNDKSIYSLSNNSGCVCVSVQISAIAEPKSAKSVTAMT